MIFLLVCRKVILRYHVAQLASRDGHLQVGWEQCDPLEQILHPLTHNVIGADLRDAARLQSKDREEDIVNIAVSDARKKINI